jgi:hypothetical protein
VGKDKLNWGRLLGPGSTHEKEECWRTSEEAATVQLVTPREMAARRFIPGNTGALHKK